jgi:hypothetical protein
MLGIDRKQANHVEGYQKEQDQQAKDHAFIAPQIAQQQREPAGLPHIGLGNSDRCHQESLRWFVAVVQL